MMKQHLCFSFFVNMEAPNSKNKWIAEARKFRSVIKSSIIQSAGIDV